MIKRIKKYLIRTFGLKGSWSWAKKQMKNGKIVRCKHWTGALKLRIDDSKNQLLQCTYYRNVDQLPMIGSPIWETSNHHLTYEDFTDYEIFG